MTNIAYITNNEDNELFKKWQDIHKDILPDYKSYLVSQYGYGLTFIKNVFPRYTYNDDFDILCYIDADCFICNKEAFQKTVSYFIDNDLDILGVPDAGVICHRASNSLYPNLFFTLFNLKKIRKFYTLNDTLEADNVDNTTIIKHNLIPVSGTYKRLEIAKKQGLSFKPPYTGCQEPYYRFFAYLVNNGMKISYLDACDSPNLDGDGATTTVFSPDRIEFAYHTWFARRYLNDEYHTKRINRVLEVIEAGKDL